MVKNFSYDPGTDVRGGAPGGRLRRGGRRGLVVALALLALLAGWARRASGSAPGPVIRHVIIQGNNRTRTEVIRRELLFAEGDCVDTALVAETARNLRQLVFLGNVDVRVRQSGKVADVVVTVSDLYSRGMAPTFSGEVGELSYGGVALDYNFLGRGHEFRAEAERDATSGFWAAGRYRVPRLRGSRHGVLSDVGVGEEGHRLQAEVYRPFYSLSASWAYSASLYSHEEVKRLYERDAPWARYKDRTDGLRLWLTRSYGDRTKLRPGVGLSLSDRRFSAGSGHSYAPEDRRRVVPSAGVVLWRPRYLKTRFVHGLGRAEDIQVGSWVSVRSGVSLGSLGTDEGFGFGQVQVSPLIALGKGGYAAGTLYCSLRRYRGRVGDLVGVAEVRTYLRLAGDHSLAFRVRWDAVGRQEDETQLLLGLENGLRGYGAQRFEGTRRIVANLEVRPTFVRQRSHVLAGAAFVDCGTVWASDGHRGPLSAGAGLGVRVALPRVYDQPVLRADVAYGFRDRAWQVSLGIGQYF